MKKVLDKVKKVCYNIIVKHEQMFGKKKGNKEMKNEKLVRVVFYVVDNFSNPWFVRKSHIGYLTETDYENAKQNNRPVFELSENDPLGKNFPQTMTM